jgi:hypothetical protein
LKKTIETFFLNSSGTPSGSLATIFMASFHWLKPGSPGEGSKLNLILVSCPKKKIKKNQIICPKNKPIKKSRRSTYQMSFMSQF